MSRAPPCPEPIGKDPNQAAKLHRSAFLRSEAQGAVERWSETVVRRQGVSRGCDFEVRCRGAFPSYGGSQGPDADLAPFCPTPRDSGLPLELTRTRSL
jgi:hypothetical protein